MELLGIGPGPEVGRAMAFLKELRVEEGPLGKEEASRRLLESWPIGTAVDAP
jgi:poly(A) polymerase